MAEPTEIEAAALWAWPHLNTTGPPSFSPLVITLSFVVSEPLEHGSRSLEAERDSAIPQKEKVGWA